MRHDGGVQRCSQIWQESSHLAYGTAPVASFWIGIEQPGSWGRQALTQSDLDPEVGARLEAAVDAAGGKVVLIRRPGEKVAARSGLRSVVVSGSQLEGPWLVVREVPEAELSGHLIELVAELERGGVEHLDLSQYQPAPAALLICTNGKRDACCAITARPLEDALLSQGADALPIGVRVWESSHLNGHRFAPTGVVLPTGQMFAWLDLDTAREALGAAAAGRLASLGPRLERGRTALPRAIQAVDVAIRGLTGETDPTGLKFIADDPAAVAHDAATYARLGLPPTGVTVVGERAWRASVSAMEAPDLPESCGKAAVPVADWAVSACSGTIGEEP